MSHLAQGLAHEACRLGFDVLFVNTHKMLQHLNGGRADGTLERRLQGYLRPDLLILDDFGLKPLAPPSPEDLYDIINERYEKGCILLTSNRAPSEWPSLLPALTVWRIAPPWWSSPEPAFAPKDARNSKRRWLSPKRST
jgi:DNA replication protein DnaC